MRTKKGQTRLTAKGSTYTPKENSRWFCFNVDGRCRHILQHTSGTIGESLARDYVGIIGLKKVPHMHHGLHCVFAHASTPVYVYVHNAHSGVASKSRLVGDKLVG